MAVEIENAGIVLVTGFGPFGEHKINASWESVKLLPNTIENYNIVKEEIEVSYQKVEDRVPELWKKYNPILVIHVGVSSTADKITIETCAHRKGYERKDCLGNNHATGKVCSSKNGDDCIHGNIKFEEISEYINKNKSIKACTSTNAGRYLCEYIYYVSLKINKNRTIFVHVPPLDKPYSGQELAEGLVDIIKCALKQCL